jgi:hypothetical protein
MYCTNCHRTNHNVETYRVKRKEDHVPVVYKVITQQIKIQRPIGILVIFVVTLDIKS